MSLKPEGLSRPLNVYPSPTERIQSFIDPRFSAVKNLQLQLHCMESVNQGLPQVLSWILLCALTRPEMSKHVESSQRPQKSDFYKAFIVCSLSLS